MWREDRIALIGALMFAEQFSAEIKMDEKIVGFRHVCFQCDFEKIPWELVSIPGAVTSIGNLKTNHSDAFDGRKIITVETRCWVTWPALNEEMRRVGINEARWYEGVMKYCAQDTSDWPYSSRVTPEKLLREWLRFVWVGDALCLTEYPDGEPQTKKLWEFIGIS